MINKGYLEEFLILVDSLAASRKYFLRISAVAQIVFVVFDFLVSW